ncbi:MAG: FAD-binding oxidoreductase [Candidatus Dormibacteraeota bacterium]|nr:FAD-binding oxidoreductase [Candidatus Dormibacteraeota bacterium]
MAVNESVLALLREAVGAKNVNAHGPVVTPDDGDAAVAAVRVCSEASTPIVARSSHDQHKEAPGDGVVLSLERLTSIDVRAPGLTLRAGAGASVESVRDRAAAEQLSVVGLGAAQGAVGSVVARGAVPRRSLTGVDAVLTTGETIVFGGAALKDVVGYDIPALLLGSMGRLAVILAVTFRLEPAGARTTVATAPGEVRVDAALQRAFDPKGLLQSAS